MVSHLNTLYSVSLSKGSLYQSSDFESNTLEFSSLIFLCQELEPKNVKPNSPAEFDFCENNSSEEAPFLLQCKNWLNETKETKEEFERTFRILQSRRSSTCSMKSSTNSHSFSDKESIDTDVFLVENSPKKVSKIFKLLKICRKNNSATLHI
jgi:hypothetical protein